MAGDLASSGLKSTPKKDRADTEAGQHASDEAGTAIFVIVIVPR